MLFVCCIQIYVFLRRDCERGRSNVPRTADDPTPMAGHEYENRNLFHRGLAQKKNTSEEVLFYELTFCKEII